MLQTLREMKERMWTNIHRLLFTIEEGTRDTTSPFTMAQLQDKLELKAKVLTDLRSHPTIRD
jgi:hypothetical protein